MPFKTVTSFETLQSEISAAESKKSKVFVLFTGTPDPRTGKSWCPDCVSADPVVQKFFSSRDSDDMVFIKVLVGDRPTWKNPQNEYRTKLRINAVPTLMRWKTSAKIAEEQLLHNDLLEMHQMSKFGVHVVTWNVENTDPPKDLSALVGLPESEYVIDVLAVGLQEVPWGFWSPSDPYSRNNAWLSYLTKILGKSEFILLSASQMCGTFAAIFVQRAVLPFVQSVESSHTPTGFFGLFGTKGAVSIRFQMHGTWFSFVNSHFAAHTWNSATRVWEYDTVLEYHTYPDQSKILDHDYVFWFGDLNYRNENVSHENALSAIKSNDFSKLFQHDQLIKLHQQGLIFSDFAESGLYFPPSYKKAVPKADEYVVCPKRLPSWCDRVLYSSATSPFSIHVLDYSDIPAFTTSDHTPVYLQANVSIPKPASNSVIQFGPVACDCLSAASPEQSNIIMTCSFSFAKKFKASLKDEIALYCKYFSRLDDDIARWRVSDFLPQKTLKINLADEVSVPLKTGFYCLIYHHYDEKQKLPRVVGLSDYFAVGDITSDDEEFDGEEDDFGFMLNGNDDYSSEENDIEDFRAGSALRCRPKSARRRRSVPPRPESARGYYDDLSVPPVSRSDSINNSLSVNEAMLTPSLPVIDAWPPSPLVQNNESVDHEPSIVNDDDDNDANDLIDDDDILDDFDDDDDEVVDELNVDAEVVDDLGDDDVDDTRG